MENKNIVTDQDTENLDAEITALTESFIEQHYLDNDEAENLEMIVAKSMVLGELYERKKWQEKATPEGFVLVPKVPSEEILPLNSLYEILDCQECCDAGGFCQERYIQIIEGISKAMIEAQEQSHD